MVKLNKTTSLSIALCLFGLAIAGGVFTPPTDAQETRRAARSTRHVVRFRAASEGQWQERLHGHRRQAGVGRTERDVVVSGGGCRVEKPSGRPATHIETDANTWREIDHGELSGIEAFAQRRLIVRGSIENALRFEPMFERPDAGGLKYRVQPVHNPGMTISTLVAGEESGEALLLLHGLGATKASWLTIVPELARRYRIIAVDLPGFGASSKPLGRYDSAWFAGHIFRLMDRLGIRDVAGLTRYAIRIGLISDER